MGWTWAFLDYRNHYGWLWSWEAFYNPSLAQIPGLSRTAMSLGEKRIKIMIAIKACWLIICYLLVLIFVGRSQCTYIYINLFINLYLFIHLASYFQTLAVDYCLSHGFHQVPHLLVHLFGSCDRLCCVQRANDCKHWEWCARYNGA